MNDPKAKGSTRYEKHISQKESDFEYGASKGPGVDKAPGDEELGEGRAIACSFGRKLCWELFD